MAQAAQASAGGSRWCPRPRARVHKGCPAAAMSLGWAPAYLLLQAIAYTWSDTETWHLEGRLCPTGSPSAPLHPLGLRALPPLLHKPSSLLPFVQSSLRGHQEPHTMTQMSLARDAAAVEGPGCSLCWDGSPACPLHMPLPGVCPDPRHHAPHDRPEENFRKQTRELYWAKLCCFPGISAQHCVITGASNVAGPGQRDRRTAPGGI